MNCSWAPGGGIYMVHAWCVRNYCFYCACAITLRAVRSSVQCSPCPAARPHALHALHARGARATSLISGRVQFIPI